MFFFYGADILHNFNTTIRQRVHAEVNTCKNVETVNLKESNVFFRMLAYVEIFSDSHCCYNTYINSMHY